MRIDDLTLASHPPTLVALGRRLCVEIGGVAMQNLDSGVSDVNESGVDPLIWTCSVTSGIW